MALGARAFYKKLGIIFDKSHGSLDRSFLKEFNNDEQIHIRAIWEQIHSFGGSTTELYKIPKSQKQAALLFSHDRQRMLASTDWIKNVTNSVSPRSIMEYGCGADFCYNTSPIT